MKRWMAVTSVIAIGLFFLAVSAASAAALPAKQKTAQGIEFLSGGVGKDEREALQAQFKGFNTRLVFADGTGKYLAAVAVRITDAQGKAVLETTTQGPWLLANLPAGGYEVKAAFQGRELTRRIQVGSEPVTALFQWKAGR